MSVVDKICHYQRNLQRCGDDEDRILHCISKLYNLPVTVQHLQETGVGRTVNSFRKYDGTVGDAAKATVFKWKVMVADSVSSDDEDEACALDVQENSTESHESKMDINEYISSLQPSAESKHGHKEIKSESPTKQNTTHPSNSRSEEKPERKHFSKHYSQNERRSSEKSSVKKEEGHGSTKHNSSKNDDVKKNSDKTAEISENSSRKRKADSSSSSMKESKKRKDSESKSDDEKSQFVSEKNHSRSKSSGFHIEVKIKVKDDKSKKDKQDKYSQERSKSCSSKSKSIESSGKEKDSDERQKHKKEEYVSRDKKHEARKDFSHHSGKETSKSKISSSSDKDHLKNKNKDKKKEHKEEKSKHEKKKETRVKLMQEINGDEGIDCNSGTSFAEALGMCTMPQPSKKRHINLSNTSLNKSIKMEPMSSPINSKKTPTVKEAECSNVSNPPSLLAPNVKLEPLNVDLASTLPEISPNYKPLPYINPIHRREETKSVDDIIYVKNQRTKVYSGNKGGYTSVPTLYDICIRVLIENIDALEYTGGVPYDILKPVLEQASADQLFMLEHYNSYLVEDTDTLWKFHCKKIFRTKERQEMESWREMYMRCLDEREAKLKTLTENIKQSIDKSVPVRSTKLAYVDNVVKPPRNIMKKQAKYGTANATPSTISSVKQKLTAGGGVNNATNISVPPPPMARFKASTSSNMKKTKAPLMAKALQLIKGRYKR